MPRLIFAVPDVKWGRVSFKGRQILAKNLVRDVWVQRQDSPRYRLVGTYYRNTRQARKVLKSGGWRPTC